MERDGRTTDGSSTADAALLCLRGEIGTLEAALHESEARNASLESLISALIAYVLWGLLPLYILTVKDVSSYEVLVQRVIWAVPFGAQCLLVGQPRT